MTQDPRQAAGETAYDRRMKLLLIVEIVGAAIDAEIAARRDASPLRRRYLDETMATTSRAALAAGMAP